MTPERSASSSLPEHEPAVGRLEAGVSSFVAEFDNGSSLAVAHQVNADWSRTLPRVSRSSLGPDDIISRFPRFFSEVIKEAVGQTLSGYSSRVAFELRVVNRRDGVAGVPASDVTPGVWTTFRTQLDSSFCTLRISADFIISLIHQLLGGQEPIEIETRPLSRIEETVLKFLCCDVVRQINERINAPLLQFEGAATSAPDWLRQHEPDTSLLDSAEFVPHLIFTSEVRVGSCRGYARSYLPYQFVSQVISGITAKSLVDGQPLGVALYPEGTCGLLKSIVTDVNLEIVVGETEVTVQELRHLEAGDVVLISRPADFWSPLVKAGSAEVIVSDGESRIIRGSIAAADNGQLSLTAEDLFGHEQGGDFTNSEKDSMHHDGNGKKIFGEDGEALAGLLFTLRVQMAARRARLEELSQLRVGQVLQLGRTANDPVDLLIDGRRIAEGQLVEIEGSLGVRVTEIAKP